MTEASAAVAAMVAAFVLGLKATVPEDYDVLRAGYVNDLFDAFIGYASSSGAVTKWRNAAGRAVLEAVGGAIEGAFYEADAEMEDDDRAWLKDTQAAQVGYLPGVFEWIKAARDADPPTITESAVEARAEAWAQALDGIRNEAVLRTKGKEMLTWHLGETEVHCTTCAKLDGKRHPAKWYIERNFIPGKPGSDTECGGWNCDCYLTDKRGNTVSL